MDERASQSNPDSLWTYQKGPRFSSASLQILETTKQLGLRYGETFAQSAFLLRGLVANTDIQNVLRAFDMSPVDILAQIDTAYPIDTDTPQLDQEMPSVKISNRLLSIINEAKTIAEQRKSPNTSPLHLFEALVQSADGMGAYILESNGITVEAYNTFLQRTRLT
ncbi:MAG TPA: Clp protease N-terminal domain-containing protein [Patescibacteria group bacterium]|nr:Clp protease N-terminal domain-containing protein [Patescibacteria group bacterium]